MTIAAESAQDREINSSQHRYIGVPRETWPGERRVAATPDTAKKLQKLGFKVLVEQGAGAAASFPDAAFKAVGCEVIGDVQSLWEKSDVILKVRPPGEHGQLQYHEADLLREGQTLISFLWPAQNQDLVQRLASRKGTVIAMDTVPRITRAQKMDALSSMANIAGYRAIVEAANHFGRCFTGQITAAGKMPPAKVLIIGAGVAGLSAIGTAKGLGAVVRAFDTRPVVKEQVNSMGAEFLELEFEEEGSGSGGYAKVMSKEFIEAEMALFREQAKEVDIIVTTALIPGKKAPLLVTRDMVESMKPGSVVVDMAAEQGGNCEVTRPDEVYSYKGVTIIGLTDLPSRMAAQASQLYGNNLVHLLSDLGGANTYSHNMEDEVIRSATIVYEGQVTWPPPQTSKPSPQPQPQPPTPPAPSTATTTEASQGDNIGRFIWLPLVAVALLGVGAYAPESFISHITVFVLAIFLGWKVIWDVTPALHTPLLSVTNAISGIILIGGMLQITSDITSPITILGVLAVLLGSINVAGGFTVTQRMLNMFRK